MTRSSKLWVVLLPATVVPCLASLFYFVLFTDRVFAYVFYVAAKLFLVFWPVACVLLVLGCGFGRLELRSVRHIRALPAGVLVGLAIVALMFAAMRTPLGQILANNSQRIDDKVRQLGILEHFWLFAVFISVLHSLVEEYYWRWFVYGRLRQVCRTGTALLLAGVSFAAHHVVVLSEFVPLGWAFFLAAAVGLGGVVWCLMYDGQKTIAGIWISHAVVDFGIMSIGYSLLSRWH